MDEHSTQLSLGAQETVCRWHTTNRYYIARVGQDLFRTWSVWIAWGGRGQRRGSDRLYAVSDRYAAGRILNRIHRLRQRHGYELVTVRRT